MLDLDDPNFYCLTCTKTYVSKRAYASLLQDNTTLVRTAIKILISHQNLMLSTITVKHERGYICLEGLTKFTGGEFMKCSFQYGIDLFIVTSVATCIKTA